MEEQRLPSHHQVYKALIPPSPPLALHAIITSGIAGAAGPTSCEPSSANRRQQLVTLHVIFPSLLLPALDLLDRGLVTRLSVVVADRAKKAPEAATSHAGILEAEPAEEPPASCLPTGRQAMDGKDQICMYTVQSTAFTASRRKRHTPQVSKTYAVHLDAWSCSCGGFALDAYPNRDSANGSTERLAGFASPPWFGNLGLNMQLGLREDFPCCKHLLACLLAEMWRGDPRCHVGDRHTTKEELAAIIGRA